MSGVLETFPEATIWAGKRYYKRHFNYIVDLYYWNMSGVGGGIENLTLGNGKLAIAWIRSDGFVNEVNIDGVEQETNGNTIDIRYEGLEFLGGDLQIGLDYHVPNLTDAQERANFPDENGLLLTSKLSHSSKKLDNHFVLQWGSEGYAQVVTKVSFDSRNPNFAQFGDRYPVELTGQSATGIRLMDYGEYRMSKDTAIMYSAYFSNLSSDDRDSDAHSYSIVVRPAFNWTKYTKTYLELGHFKEEDNDFEEVSSKFTIAQAFSAGPAILDRPEIRIFASYLDSEINDRGVFRDEETDTWSVGMQMEVWW